MSAHAAAGARTAARASREPSAHRIGRGVMGRIIASRNRAHQQVYATEGGFAHMTDETSRRNVLRAGLGVLAGALIPARALAQQKIAQKLVQYQGKPEGRQEWDNCLDFGARRRW